MSKPCLLSFTIVICYTYIDTKDGPSFNLQHTHTAHKAHKWSVWHADGVGLNSETMIAQTKCTHIVYIYSTIHFVCGKQQNVQPNREAKFYKKKRRKIDSNKYFSHTNGIWLFVSISFNGSRVKFSF